MAANNSLRIIGNVGQDPVFRTTESGKMVTNFSVAVRTGKDTPPLWVGVECWGNQAGMAQDLVTKGSTVAVDGRLKVDQHDGKTYIKCVAESFFMCSKKQGADDQQPAGKAKETPADSDDGDDGDIPPF